MKGPKDDFRSVLAGAIYREIGARDFYMRISEAIKNAEGKERFGRLSADEDGHREKLSGWYRKLFDEPFVPDKKGLSAAEVKGVKVDKKTGAMAALDLAIKAEEKSEEFYAAQAGTATDAKLKKLLTDLSAEEHGHYELLLGERQALAGNFYWFDIDSAQFLED